jgi:succinate dehydrogenase cytochrome b556 subunit
MSSFLSNLQQLVLYQGREGQIGFIARRLAGLGTLFFLAIHILDTATVYFVPSLYGEAIGIYRSLPFMLGEIGLVAAVLYHGVNGLNVIFQDTFPHWWSKPSERASFWRVMVVTVVLWLPLAMYMGTKLYVYNICNCPTSEPPFTATYLGPAVALAVFVVVLLVLVWGKPPKAPAAGAARGLEPKRSLEAWAWLFMRWSGALLVPLAWGHVLLQDALVGVHAINLDYVALRWSMAGWRVYDAALLLFAFGHGMNGLRGILNEYLRASRWQRLANGLWVLLAVALFIIGGLAIIGGVTPLGGVK